MQFQVAGGPVAVESDLLGFGLGHRQGVRVQPERRLVAPLAVHPMGPLDLAHRCRRHRPCPPIQIQRQTCDGRSDRIGQRGGEAFETRGTSSMDKLQLLPTYHLPESALEMLIA
ncbi:hypothetical protein GW17_00027903 [Ensete ventricosum]|nr:hypothetical protein GW17_00027903 [Ensete ventricosum]